MSESEYVSYANSIVLQIDEANRTITNDGTNTPIILGVRGDDCAERIYFESPKQLSPEIDLLEQSDVEDELKTVKVNVYVNYRNAVNEPYIQECSTPTQSVTSDMVRFSWIITNKATINRGEVKFNVCVKRTVYNKETKKWELTNEWHTTTFVGKVLDGIDVTKKTPEIITHDSITIQQLDDQVNAYAQAVSTYAENLETLNTSLANVNAYVDTVVGPAVTSEVDAKMGNYALIEYVDEKISETYSEIEDIREHMDGDYLFLYGGEMGGNIEFASGGIVSSNEKAAGGFEFDIDGTPVIISDTMSIRVGTDPDPLLAEYTYHFPTPESKEGTLALISDIPEAPKYYEHRITIFSDNDDTFAYARFVSKSDHPISGITELAGVIRSYVKATNVQNAIMATGLSKSSVESECGPVCSLYAYSETELRLTYIDSSYDMQFRDVTETDWSTSDEVVEIN